MTRSDTDRTAARRTPGRPRDGDSQATRRLVLDAAITEFAQHGFAGTSTRAIVDRAGITSATLYHHFGSKRGLFVETYRYAVHLVTERYDVAVAGCRGLRAEIKAIIRSADEIMTERYEITVFVMRAQTELAASELTGDLAEGGRDFVARLTQRAVDRGDLASDDVPAMDLLIPCLLWGLSIVGRTGPERDMVVGALSRLVDGQLFAKRRVSATR